jgi:hypothetical protein
MEHGRLVEFVTSNGVPKRHIVPMRLFAGRGDEALGELLNLDWKLSGIPKPCALLYPEAAPALRYTTALCTGWRGHFRPAGKCRA